MENLEERLEKLERLGTNDESFWKRAFTVIGYNLAVWGVFYGALLSLAFLYGFIGAL